MILLLKNANDESKMCRKKSIKGDTKIQKGKEAEAKNMKKEISNFQTEKIMKKPFAHNQTRE